MDPHQVALAHEWLDQRSGSEKTFEALAAAFPGADLYALYDALGGEFGGHGRSPRTTFLDAPFIRDRRALALPLMPLAWRTATKRRYDVVITSSHACVKGFRPARDALHLCYCYTPMRYVWDTFDVRSRAQSLARLGPAQAMRRWDRRSARWVDHFAAISTAVQQRIADCYGRESRVIAPPVDTDFYTPGPAFGPDPLPAKEYVLACSRFVPYKRIDLAIRAADAVGIGIVVAGGGPAEGALRALAQQVRVPVRFEKPDDVRLRDLYRGASAFLFPALEDFGIVAVEAQACGTPVVGLRAGGSLDTVVDGLTGVLAEAQEVEPFAEALRSVLAQGLGGDACVQHAASFSTPAFTARIHEWVADCTAGLTSRPTPTAAAAPAA